jgi:glycosyltransferase involved in cell wall biosynthesis
MRICYLADGRYIHAHRWLQFFSERGHQMSLFSFAPMQAHHVAAVENAGARYLGELSAFHLKRFWRTARELQRVRTTLRREKVDIVHSHFLGANAWYAALSGFHPAIITVMGGDILGENWRPGTDIRERWLTPYALRKADLITCWSQKLVSVVKRYSRPDAPVEVIHGGVDMSRFRPGPKSQQLRKQLNIPAEAKIVLSPRLMRPLYNLDKLAVAAEAVWAAEPETYFLFAVLPEAKDLEYEQRVRGILGRDSRVRFLDAIRHDEMPDYYRLADVTVSIPSSDGTPMSVLESLACGTPVVVSDIPHYDRDYIDRDKTALFADPRDAQSVATAILRLLREPALAHGLASEGRGRVEEMGSYESQMSKMERLYFSLVDASPAA